MSEKVDNQFDICEVVDNANPLLCEQRDFQLLGQLTPSSFHQSIHNNLIKLYDGIAISVSRKLQVEQDLLVRESGNGCFSIAISLQSPWTLVNTGQKDQDNTVYLSGLMHDAAEVNVAEAGSVTNAITIFLTAQGLEQLCLSGAVAAPVIKRLQQRIFVRPFFGESLPPDPGLINCAWQVVHHLDHGDNCNFLLFSAKLHELLHGVLTNLDFSQSIKRNPTQTARLNIEEFKLYLDKLSQFNFTLEQLASKFGVSVSLLQKQFKKRYGMAISQYIQQLRITQANDLIVAADMSTLEIAQRLGYASINSLGRALRQSTGRSITELRSLNQAPAYRR